MSLATHKDQGSLYYACLETESEEFQAELYREQVEDFYRQQEFNKIINELSKDEVNFIVYKGSALAHVYYPCSVARPRLDHDILISDEQCALVEKCLLKNAYQRYPQLEVFNEKLYFKVDQNGIQHVWDVHTQISNRSFFAKLFSFSELWQNKKLFKFSSGEFYIPHPVEHFLILLSHMAGHHADDFRWIWFKDLFLLWQSMSDDEKRQLFSLAQEKELSSLLNFYLFKMKDIFAVKDPLLPKQPITAVLDGGAWYLQKRSTKQIVLKDIKDLKSLSQQFFYCKEFLWPKGPYLGRQKLSFFAKLRRLSRVFKRFA